MVKVNHCALQKVADLVQSAIPHDASQQKLE